jgi:molecular chaperone DnaK (HSP70)
MRTGRERSVEVKPSYGLTDEEIERLLEESIDFAEDDVTHRLLIEARVEAETLLHVTEKQLQQYAAFLQPGEGGRIRAAVSALQEAKEGEDYNRTRDLIEELGNLSAPFAQRIMDTSIGEVLGGKELGKV